MTAATELRRRIRGLQFILEIDGITQRFYGPHGIAPSVSSPYTAVHAIRSVTDTETTLSPVGGIEEGGEVTVTLANTTQAGLNTILGRVTHKGASRTLRLAESIPMEAAGVSTLADVEVTGSLTGWPSSGYFWIGQECIAYTGTASGPNRFTGLTRGALGTRVQEHTFDSGKGWAPFITSECVNWRTRRARLKIANVRADGSMTSDSWTIVSGFIDTSPVFNRDDTEVMVTIVPWVHRLSEEIGGKDEETHLVDTHHYFEQTGATRFRHVMGWPMAALINETTISSYSVQTSPDGQGGNTELHTPSGGTNGLHDQYYDITLADEHPRRGAVVVGPGGASYRLLPTAYGTDGNDVAQLDFASLPANIPHGSRVVNPAIFEEFEVDVLDGGDEELLEWPGEVLDIINTSLNVTTTAGAGGRWAYLSIVPSATLPDGNDGPALVARLNAYDSPAGALGVTFQSDRHGLWYPIDMAHPDDTTHFRPLSRRANARPRQEDIGWSALREVRATQDPSVDRADTYPIRGFCTGGWWCQERYLLVQDNVVGTPSAAEPVWIRIEYDPRFDGDGDEIEGRAWTYLQVIGVTATLDGATQVGYRYEISLESRLNAFPFGNWPGSKKVIVRPVARIEDELPTEALLKILLSSTGEGINHADYDVLPFGVGYTTAELDVDSFLRFPMPGGVSRVTLDLVEGRPAAEWMGGLLKALGGALVMRTDPTSGDRKVALVPVSLENALLAISGTADGDWSGPVASVTDERIINRWEYSLNYDWRTRKFGQTVQYNDQDSRTDHDESKAQKLEVFGLMVDNQSPAAMQGLLRPIFNELRASMGSPRRVWRGTLAHGDAADWHPGVSILVTAADAKGYSGARGVTALPAILRAMRVGWMDGVVDVELEHHAVNTTGWAPALRSSIASGSTATITVNANRFTETTHPITGGAQTDLGYVSGTTESLYFRPGDIVRVVPRGNRAGAVSRSVDSVNRAANTITLTVAVAISVGDSIRITDYTNATGHQRGYAFHADSNATLGASNDEAKDYN